MNIEQLRYLVAFAETGSYKDAATDLFVTTQAVSKGLKLLGEELGYALVDRVEDRVVLSEKGERILPYARRALWNIGAILDTSTDASSGISLPSRVKMAVGFVPARGVAFEVEQVDRLRAMFPNTAFEVSYVSDERCFLSLRSGVVDVCIVGGAYPDTSAKMVQLYVGNAAVATIATNPLCEKGAICLRDLSEMRVAQPIDVGYFQSELLCCYEENGIRPPVIVSEPFDLNSLYEFMKEGGAVFVDERTCKMNKVLPNVVLSRVHSDIPPIVISLVYHDDASAEWKRYLGQAIRDLF